MQTVKNRLSFLLVITLLLIAVPVNSQPIETVIKTQALEMARAVMTKDVNKLVLYMPPKLVAEVGGKEKLMAARDTVNKFMTQFGAEIKKVLIGEPTKIISYKNQLQT